MKTPKALQGSSFKKLKREDKEGQALFEKLYD
jgi:hypothetical protein